MNWKFLFKKQILNRGKSYFYSDQVHQLNKNGHTITSKVVGYDIYNVKIKLSKDEQTILDMKCSCPYAQDHNFCKHEAATLYAYEDFLKTENKQTQFVKFQTEVLPKIKKEFSKKDYYFHLDELIAQLPIRYDIWQEGTNLINDPLLQWSEPEIEFNYWDMGDNEQVLSVETFYNDRMAANMKIKANEFISFSCAQGHCHSYNTRYETHHSICEHQAAMLILTMQYIWEYNPGDQTDRNGMAFLNTFVQDSKPNKEKHLRLIPRLLENNGDLSFSIWIGKDKMYKIRSITNFIENLHQNKPYVISKKTEFQFDKTSFDEAYLPLLELMESKVIERENTPNRYGYENLRIGSEIELYGQTIDTFYDLAQQLPVENKSGKPIQTETRQLDVSFVVKPYKQNDKIVAVDVSGHIPKTTQGIRYSYYFENNTFYRMDQNKAKQFERMPRDENNNISFRIGTKNLTYFYYHQLPQLQKTCHVEIDQAEDIEALMPPEPEFTFYLDAVDDYVFCSIDATYNETTYHVLEDVETLDDNKQSFRPKDMSLRQADKEYETLLLLNEYGFGFYEHQLFLPKEDDLIYRFLTEGIDELLSYGKVEATPAFKRLQVITKPKITVGVSVSHDLMDIDITSDALTQDELIEILSHYKEKKTYHRLKSGKYIDMNEESLESLEQIMESLHMSPKQLVSGKMNVPMYRAFYLDRMLAEKNSLKEKKDRGFRNIIKNFKNQEYELPKDLRADLRPYQEDGYQWIKTLETYHFGGILADEMGLGKTLQVITAFASHKEQESSPSLVVCPASLVYNWKAEMEKFAPGLQSVLIIGTKNERKEIIENYTNYDVLVTSYDLLKRDIDLYEDCQFYYEVIDEAQYTKNHTTAAAKSVKLIHSQCRLALTGTPIENQLQELWSIFDFLMPGFLYSYEYFRKNVEIPIVKEQDSEPLEQLRKMISPFILRRLKKDVLKDLPDKLEKILYVSMEKKQTHVYDGQVSQLKKFLQKTNDDDFKKQRFQVLSQLMRIRQICCDPGLCFEDYDGSSAKKDACINLIENAIDGGHKILVFSQFTSMLERLEQECDKREIQYYEITGATPKSKRMEYVNTFNEDDVPVFFISLKAGGTGLNLTGADIVIHYDPWWNTAAQNQATDRAHRIGQQNDVTVYKLIIKDTIEEKILELQEKKQALADDILSGEKMSNTTISKEDLEALLK